MSEIVTIHIFDTITNAMKSAVNFGETKDIEVVNPLDCWRDVMVLPDIDSGISYFALKTGGRGESKWDIMIHVEKAIKVYNEVPFVIRFDGNHVIGTFHIQCGSLSSWRCSSYLRKICIRSCYCDSEERRGGNGRVSLSPTM